MTLEQLEAEILALPKDSLARLIARLIEQLGQSEIEPEIASVWTKEAEVRDNDMSTDKVIGYPAHEVFQRLRTSWQ